MIVMYACASRTGLVSGLANTKQVYITILFERSSVASDIVNWLARNKNVGHVILMEMPTYLSTMAAKVKPDLFITVSTSL